MDFKSMKSISRKGLRSVAKMDWLRRKDDGLRVLFFDATSGLNNLGHLYSFNAQKYIKPFY